MLVGQTNAPSSVPYLPNSPRYSPSMLHTVMRTAPWSAWVELERLTTYRMPASVTAVFIGLLKPRPVSASRPMVCEYFRGGGGTITIMAFVPFGDVRYHMSS